MNHDQTAKPIGQLMDKALTAAAPSQGQSTRGSTSSPETERRKHFLTVFRRWEALFKRSDRGDVQAEKWLIAEYYDSLKHLSPAGLEALTKQLKERCTFFPTIKECLEVTRCGKYEWGNPFHNPKPALFVSAAPVSQIGMTRALSDQREGDDGLHE